MAHKRDNRRAGKIETLRRKQVRAVKYLSNDLPESLLSPELPDWTWV